MSPLKTLLIAAALVVGPVWVARADTLWIGETVSRAIKADNVKVTSVEGDKLNYTTDLSMKTSKQLSQLVQINIDGETSFNSAENAYGSGDMETAITNYQQVLQSASAKDWMQSRAAARLIAAAKMKNRYDAEVSAYCSLLLKDPKSAAGNKPGTPPEHSPYLDSALTSVSKTLDGSNLNASQKSTLLNLQLEIDRAKGDKSAVNATLAQLVALGAADPGTVAMLKLATANIDLDAKAYDKAVTDIDQNRTMFTEPDQQVEALYVLAQAHMGIDGNTTDPEKLKDLALAYMRVVTFGSKLPDRPHVADSLLQAAQLEEKLGEKQAATQLYEQLAKDKTFAATPAGAKARTVLSQQSKEGPAVK